MRLPARAARNMQVAKGRLKPEVPEHICPKALKSVRAGTAKKTTQKVSGVYPNPVVREGGRVGAASPAQEGN